MKKSNVDVLKWILAAFLLWRAGLTLIAWGGEKFIPLNQGFLGGGIFPGNSSWRVWANFEGVNYLNSVKSGGGSCLPGIFPFYPFLVHLFSLVIKNDLLAALLVSHLAFLTALYFFYRLVRIDFSEKVAKRSLMTLLIFPTSFFFVSVYPEALFLMLILGSFLAVKESQWLTAAFLAGLASATSLVGFFLFPALIYEWWHQRLRQRKASFKEAVPLLFISLSIIFYFLFMSLTVKDLPRFFNLQFYLGSSGAGGKVVLLYQVFWRYIKMLITVEKLTPTYFVVLLESLSGVLFLFLTIFVYLRRWFSSLIFMALAFLAPTLSGTFSSMPRYVLILFPGFILLAIWAEKYRWFRRLYPMISLPLLIISVLLFTRGFFIA